MIKNPWWIPYCAFVGLDALGAVNSRHHGNPLWAVDVLVYCCCFGWGYAKIWRSA